ncbi:unnamed protein product [Psylliodes chrysocephalus]|uniref:Uncharacterized protein n=1 Tax=Psylliodes chrysocephalus TaxID=3402493 RepID=A0A9P0D5B0_9CUCU|nr:unnamed protein product [Psylliodes chrysocephala]
MVLLRQLILDLERKDLDNHNVIFQKGKDPNLDAFQRPCNHNTKAFQCSLVKISDITRAREKFYSEPVKTIQDQKLCHLISNVTLYEGIEIDVAKYEGIDIDIDVTHEGIGTNNIDDKENANEVEHEANEENVELIYIDAPASQKIESRKRTKNNALSVLPENLIEHFSIFSKSQEAIVQVLNKNIKKNIKMASKKYNTEEERIKKRREQVKLNMRRMRERIKNDPVKHEEEKQKERDRWKRRL